MEQRHSRLWLLCVRNRKQSGKPAKKPRKQRRRNAGSGRSRKNGKRSTKVIKEDVIRIGSGYDAHRLVEGRDLVLGGVKIPYEKGLLGHSDADVLLHAVMDALLGAAALGDIGRHFPDSDPAYKGADSKKLLSEVWGLIFANGYCIMNVDATIIAQKPKLAPYIEEMRRNIAKALQIEIGQVNIKATTEEGMGFTGAGEGIAASAVCLLENREK